MSVNRSDLLAINAAATAFLKRFLVQENISHFENSWSFQISWIWSPAMRDSELFIKSMITDWIGLHEVLLPINHKITIPEKRRNVKLWKNGKICIRRLAWQRRRKLFNATLKLKLIDLNNNVHWFECDSVI